MKLNKNENLEDFKYDLEEEDHLVHEEEEKYLEKLPSKYKDFKKFKANFYIDSEFYKDQLISLQVLVEYEIIIKGELIKEKYIYILIDSYFSKFLNIVYFIDKFSLDKNIDVFFEDLSNNEEEPLVYLCFSQHLLIISHIQSLKVRLDSNMSIK